MRRTRTIAAAPLVAAVTILSVCGPARAGLQLGARAGYADLQGDVFRGSGDLSGTGLFGIQAIFSALPRVNLCLAGEAKNDKLTFSGAGDLSEQFNGKAEWRDLGLYASLHLHLIPIGVGPLGLYAGGGGGVHFTEMTLSDVTSSTPKSAAGPLGAAGPVDDFIKQVEEKKSDFAWHLLAGTSFSLPVLPLAVFAEVRFEDVTGDFTPRGYSAYAGLNLSLD